MLKQQFFIVVALSLFLFFSCTNANKKDCEIRSIGTYLFSQELSKIDTSDLLLLKGVTLTIKKDGHFIISKKIPSFSDSAGKWEANSIVVIEGRHDFITLFFNNGKKTDISCCCAQDRQIEIASQYYLSKKGITKNGFLAFVRQL